MQSRRKYHLRAVPQSVGWNRSEVYNLDGWHHPRDYYYNDFEDNYDGTVTDHATGLMWVKQPKNSFYETIVSHVDFLRINHFAGYNDWRLPTIPEFISLMEPEKQANGLHISTIFKDPSWSYLSADSDIGRIRYAGTYVDVDFLDYRISGSRGQGSIFAVRSIHESDIDFDVNKPWTPCLPGLI